MSQLLCITGHRVQHNQDTTDVTTQCRRTAACKEAGPCHRSRSMSLTLGIDVVARCLVRGLVPQSATLVVQVVLAAVPLAQRAHLPQHCALLQRLQNIFYCFTARANSLWKIRTAIHFIQGAADSRLSIFSFKHLATLSTARFTISDDTRINH